MNYIEALQALVDGKKIRHKSWDKGVYRFIGADDKFYNDISAQTSFMIYNKNEILSDSWEIYQTEEERLITNGKRWSIYRTCTGLNCSKCRENKPNLRKMCDEINDGALNGKVYDMPADEVDKLYDAVKGEIDA